MNTEKNTKQTVTNAKTEAQKGKNVKTVDGKTVDGKTVDGKTESRASALSKMKCNVKAAAQDNRFQSGLGVGFEQDR